MRRCVCPGSYDPITLGHLDVAVRATALFDEVVLAIMTNPAKTGLFAVQDQLRLIDAAIADLDPGIAQRIRVEASSGELLVDLCQRLDAVALVKGLRSATDFSYERPMALMNRHLTGVETVFLSGDPALEHVSSSLVKEVALLGGDVSELVPTSVARALEEVVLERQRGEG